MRAIEFFSYLDTAAKRLYEHKGLPENVLLKF